MPSRCRILGFDKITELLTAPSAVHLTTCFSPDSHQRRLSVKASLPLSPLQRFGVLNWFGFYHQNFLLSIVNYKKIIEKKVFFCFTLIRKFPKSSDFPLIIYNSEQGDFAEVLANFFQKRFFTVYYEIFFQMPNLALILMRNLRLDKYCSKPYNCLQANKSWRSRLCRTAIFKIQTSAFSIKN